MSTQFNCFESINILNVDGSINTGSDGTGFDFTLFDYINLSSYGSNLFTKIASNEELISAFSALGIEVELDLVNSSIVLLTDIQETSDLPTFVNPRIQLLLNNTPINPLDFSLYNSINVSFHNAPTIFVYSEQQLIDKLKLLYNIDNVIVTTTFIYLDKYTGSYQDLPVGNDPVIYLVDTEGNQLMCNFNTIQSIDLSFYGGNAITFVNTEAAIISAFAALGITVSITACSIKLVEYLGTTQNLPVCFYPIITLQNSCINNTIDYTAFEYVDFTPLGGGFVQISNQQQLLSALMGLNIIAEIQGCNIKVLNQPCDQSFNLELATRQSAVPTANNDTIFPCLLVGTDYTFNPTTNDIDSENQPLAIIKINNVDVIPNGPPVTIALGTTAQLLLGNNIKIQSTNNALNGSEVFSYTITNLDNNTSTANITYCINNVIDAEDDFVTFDCDSSESILVTSNDMGAGPFTVTHINGIAVTGGQSVDIIANSVTATLEPDLNTITLTSINNYFGMGSFIYTITNGGAISTGTVNYNILNTCNPCINFDFGFSFNCAETCWTTLTYNGNPVTNYLIKLKKPDNSFYVLPSGITFSIASGTYSNPLSFPPNLCAYIEANTYTLYIEFSDYGNNLDCLANTYTILPMLCGSSCQFQYNGPGGPAAQLAFDVEVSPTATISTSFSANKVPDGMVIMYNGQPIYHTGNSADCPYISNSAFSQAYANCVNCNYLPETPIQTAVTPVPYVPGVNTAKIIVFGYPCAATTVWNLSVSTDCMALTN